MRLSYLFKNAVDPLIKNNIMKITFYVYLVKIPNNN